MTDYTAPYERVHRNAAALRDYELVHEFITAWHEVRARSIQICGRGVYQWIATA
jgi:hypothetical protein